MRTFLAFFISSKKDFFVFFTIARIYKKLYLGMLKTIDKK